MDAVQKVGNGHPGTAMSLAPAAYLLYQRILRHDPADPQWPGRDRFVLSCGHSSLTLYIQLYLSGYALSLDDLKALRTWGSITPGHPEYGLTPGVEVTTGPLGQGIGNAVGMAMAARRERGLFDPDAAPGTSPFDHFVYAFCSDGDIEEGISHESSSIAAVQELGNLIVMYDDNYISIEDNTRIAKSEDVGARYEAYGWHVQHVDWHTADGGYHENVQALYDAFEAAKAVTDKPSFIVLHTIIGWPAPTKKDTGAAHGSALGAPEVAATKEILGFDPAVDFPVEEEALSRGRARSPSAARPCTRRGTSSSRAGKISLPNGPRSSPGWPRTLFPAGWTDALPVFPADPKGIATRKASGEVLSALAPVLPELWGGSADLAESNLTTMKGEPSFLPTNRQTAMWQGGPYGRTLHFGIREHGMGSILNGIAVHGGTRVYGGTFLQFSDYMRGAVRLAALMEQPVTYVWTHDSVGLGEDGPTHQPIEHLWSLRNIPHLDVVRPADANETAAAWQAILEHTDRPAALCLQPAERADVRPGDLRPGRGRGARRVRDGGRHRRDLDRDRVRGADRGRGARAARRRRHLGPGRVDAVHGMVYRAGRFLSRGSAAGRDAGAGVGRGGHHAAVEDLRRRRRRVDRRRSLRRLGGRGRDLREVRHHGRGGGRRREVVHRQGASLARAHPTDLSKPYRPRRKQ